MTTTNYKFQGWLGHDASSVDGNMTWGEFEPKKWEEDDVDIRITHCSVCGADVHTLKSGWGPTAYPICVGHEIVGSAVKVGKDVKNIKVGDRVGVGPQARSCMKPDCPECSAGRERHCTCNVGTYGSTYPDGVSKSYGGFADYNRTHAHWVFKIPDGLPAEDAAPMLCAGVTVYSPLKRHGCGPGKTMGVIGVGGLGHFAILFAKALGADKVVGISRKTSKKEDVRQLGADQYIATEDEKDWASQNFRSLDLIICTVSSGNMPMNEYLSLLKVGGAFVQVGAPDGGNLPPINAFALIMNGISVEGSMTGPHSDIVEMLQLAADKKIKPWVQKRPMEDANQTIVDMANGDARYRYVLVNEKHA